MATYNADSKLGFMRVIQVCNVLNIFANFVALIWVSGSDLHGVDAYAAFDVALNVICLGEVAWLIWHRKQYTRQIAVAMYAVTALSSIVLLGLTYRLTPFNVFCALLPPLLMSIYFLTSRRAKAVLVQPFDMRFRDKSLGKNKVFWNPRSSDFWLRLLIYFFVFSVAGHWMEMGVQVLVVHGLFPGTAAGPDSLTWRDKLNPFFIYGIAVAFCGLVLYPVYLKLKEKMPRIWQAYAASFFLNMVFCVVAELILGFLFNADYSAWDYRDQFMNFHGQICLLYSLCFGVASSAITWFVYPLMERQFSYVSHEAFRFVFVGSLVLFLFIVFTYNFDPATLGLPGVSSFSAG